MVQDLERRLYGEELWVHGLWCGGETWGRCNTLINQQWLVKLPGGEQRAN